MFASDNPSAPVRIVPLGTPDQLDEWYSEQHEYYQEDEDPTFDPDNPYDEDLYEDHLSDVEADAMTLASAGYGTDEDYGYFGDELEPPF